MRTRLALTLPFVLVAVLSLGTVPAHAGPILTIGSGSAVTRTDAVADFEDPASLFGDLYVEDGIAFSRTNLPFFTNGCGVAGCPGSFSGFSGNFLYGVYREDGAAGELGASRSTHGFFTIAATEGRLFSGLEFASDAGFGAGIVDDTVWWQAYRLGVSVGGGVLSPGTSLVLGFSDPAGFDELRYTRWSYEVDAPALDKVRAQYVGSVPDPGSTLLLFGISLVGLRTWRKRRQ